MKELRRGKRKEGRKEEMKEGINEERNGVGEGRFKEGSTEGEEVEKEFRKKSGWQIKEGSREGRR
jgi:hypothetical protein